MADSRTVATDLRGDVFCGKRSLPLRHLIPGTC